MPNMTIGKESTIKEFIRDYANESFTYDICYLKDVFTTTEGKKLLINGDSVLDRYQADLQEFKQSLVLSDEEYRKYKYNPKRMSFDIYGTTELWFLILHANELSSVSEFDLQTMQIYNGGVVQFINKVIDLEALYKDYNEDLVTKELNN